MSLHFPDRRSVLKTGGAGLLSMMFTGANRSLAQPVPAAPVTQIVWHEIPADISVVDTKLVLLADVSSSINRDGTVDEVALQLEGTRYALTHPNVIAAVERKAKKGIALTFGCFGYDAVQTVPMVIVRSRADLEAFALRLVMTDKPEIRGGTHIGKGINKAAGWLTDSPCDAFRKVVDVSGDGPDNENLYEEKPTYYLSENTVDPMTHPMARKTVIDAVAFAAQQGVTVNGLPICTDEPNLDEYYGACVMTPPGMYSHKVMIRGREYKEETPGGFVIPARDRNSYGEMLARKLTQEMA